MFIVFHLFDILDLIIGNSIETDITLGILITGKSMIVDLLNAPVSYSIVCPRDIHQDFLIVIRSESIFMISTTKCGSQLGIDPVSFQEYLVIARMSRFVRMAVF